LIIVTWFFSVLDKDLGGEEDEEGEVDDEEEGFDENEEEVVEGEEDELEDEEQEEVDADTPTKRKRVSKSGSKRRKPREIDTCAQEKTLVCLFRLIRNECKPFNNLCVRACN